MPTVIELRDISKHYGNIIGVDSVNLSIEDGEFLTLLGPSGCGKSTLLRMIGGFEVPTTGQVLLDGLDVNELPPQKRDINMMCQDYALFPHMSVRDNISYGLKMKGIKGAAVGKEVAEALDLVGLADKIDQMPHQLSGGQKQRIALARAVVREPKVLLLDEPLSALDANLREQMQIELKHMQSQLGITFVMVTHDQTEALVMSDRVVVMQDGNVAQDGTPIDLYERPASRYVANFIGTTNFLTASFMARTQDNNTQVRVGDAALTVATATDVSENTPLTIGIRPEKIRILTNGEVPETNVLTGKITENIYSGLGLRTAVKLNTNETIFVDELLPRGMANSSHASVGDEVSLTFEPDNVLLFETGRP
jgi:putative spermidine/putrescine transport system ATP-binding protein/spermidine/putrescine transport system ATP-binding protein